MGNKQFPVPNASSPGGSGGGSGTVTSVTFTGDGTVLSSTPSSAVTTTGTLTAAIANAPGGTVLGNNTTSSAAPAYTTAPIIGIPGTSTGSIALASATASGKYTITAPANAATPTLTLPTGTGTFAVTAVSPIVLNATTGALTFNGSGAITWDQIGNAAGALTLANAGNATTFNQTSAVNWTWANTTAATSGTSQSSPIFNINGTYWTGAASATDSWTIQDVVANGTNGTSQLTFTHTGTTGASAVVVAGAGSAGNPALGLGGIGSGFWTSTNLLSCQIGASNAAGNLRFYGGSTQYMNLGFSASGGSNQLSSSAANSNMIISGNVTTSGLTPGSVTLNNGSSFTATSGTAVAVLVGVGSNAAGSVTFAPTSGSANFVGVDVNPTINQTGTSSGNYTGLLVNVVETSLKGTDNRLLDLQSGATGGTSVFRVDNSGNLTQSTANGAQWISGSSSELLTLSTSGLTTDTTANLLPANSIIESVVCRVTTTITTTTNWAVGDATTSARFSSPNATLTSGTTSVGLNHMQGSVSTDAAGPVQTSAAKVRITCTGSNPGAGVIRITVFYRQFVAPTS